MSRVTAELKLVTAGGPDGPERTCGVEVECFSQQQDVLVEWEGLREKGGASAAHRLMRSNHRTHAQLIL